MERDYKYYVNGKEVDEKTYIDAVESARIRNAWHNFLHPFEDHLDEIPSIKNEIVEAPKHEETNCDMCAIVESLSNKLKGLEEENAELRSEIAKYQTVAITEDVIKMYTNIFQAISNLESKVDSIAEQNNTNTQCKSKKNS